MYAYGSESGSLHSIVTRSMCKTLLLRFNTTAICMVTIHRQERSFITGVHLTIKRQLNNYLNSE